MKPAVIAGVVVLLASSVPMAQVRGRGGAASSTKPIRPTSVRVVVHDRDGANLDHAQIVLSGDGSGEFTTAGAGMVILPNLKDGTYRLHVEHDGFIPLEREFALQSGAPATVDIALNALPPPPPPPPPPPVVAKVAPPSGPMVTVSVVDFLDRNFIGREPLRESVLACTPLETVRLLQMRDPVATHTHADVDEVLYVVAGEGEARLNEQSVPLKAGTMVVVPHGSAHSFERRGKNPLMVLSTLSGAPCQDSVGSK